MNGKDEDKSALQWFFEPKSKRIGDSQKDMFAQLDRIEAKLDELLAKKKRVVKRVSTFKYPEDFAILWANYPKRAGSNPKNKAYSAWSARYKSADRAGSDEYQELHSKMIIGVSRYKDYCDATGKNGTEFVMQAATFFGPDKHYENDWTIPKSAQRDPMPRNDEDLEAFAVGHKLHSWGNAPEQIRNMRQYREWIKERM